LALGSFLPSSSRCQIFSSEIYLRKQHDLLSPKRFEIQGWINLNFQVKSFCLHSRFTSLDLYSSNKKYDNFLWILICCNVLLPFHGAFLRRVFQKGFTWKITDEYLQKISNNQPIVIIFHDIFSPKFDMVLAHPHKLEILQD
jgi:hypothetical protein